MIGELLKWIVVGLFVLLGIVVLGIGAYACLTDDDFPKPKRSSKKSKKRKILKDYPSIPLTMATNHFGWSFELDKYTGWTWYVWCIRDDGRKVIMDTCESKPEAIRLCNKFEEQFFGG